jgi:hypothetical protein
MLHIGKYGVGKLAFTKFTNKTITLAGTSKIVFPDGSEQDTALESGQITLTDGKVLIGNASNIADPITLSGNATTTRLGVVSVSNLTMASEARGDIVRRGASVWAALSAKGSGQILIGDGTDVISSAVTGDISITGGGVTAIGSGKVLSAMLSEKTVQYAEVSIPSADIVSVSAGKFGHAAGQEVVASPGAGKAIEFLSATVIYDFAVAAYTGGGNITVNFAASDPVSGLVSAANSVGAAADKIALVLAAVPTNNQLLAATALNLVSAAAFTQPGTAAGVIRVKVAYRVHTTGL